MKATQTSSTPVTDRRSFLKTTGLGAGLMVLPSFVAGASPSQLSPSSRLNIAMVGVGGKGRAHLLELQDENIVALCDVDMNSIEKGKNHRTQGEAYSAALAKVEKKGAKWFTDYREMFADMGDKIDAVIIAIPDHMHFPVALSALNLGKHVYCEKPLTHTVEEARILKEAAEKAGVVTQMGNQGHSTAGTRIIREWIQAGVIGQVREVHSWTNRPIWAQGEAALEKRKQGPKKPPAGLDWDLWQGVAEPRDYNSAAVPFGWRSWSEYGCGSLGDMACHIMDAAYWALDLGMPSWVEAVTTPVTDETFPQSSKVTYRFPKRGSFDPVTYHWYDGGLQPVFPSGIEIPEMPAIGATLYVGTEAMIIGDCYSESVRMLPETKFREIRSDLPAKTLRRIKGTHQMEWVNAIREGRPASSDFSYAAPFTEMVLMGTIAQRIHNRLHVNRAQGMFRDHPAANGMLSKAYPKGWIVS
jgi:predicted dehydrogenase